MVFSSMKASFPRLARAALAACAGAGLTLYVFNIYPIDVLASESDWLTIDQVFDFQVPQEVIEGGVSNALSVTPSQDTNLEMYSMLDSQEEYLVSLADDVNQWDMVNRLSGGKLGTNYYEFRIASLWSNSYEAGGLSSLALGFSKNDASSNQYMWTGEDNPYFIVPELEGVVASLSSDTLPEDSAFQTANPLIQGLAPPASWFLSTLPHGSLYDAVFAPFQTEIDRVAGWEFKGVRTFSYLPNTLHDVCDNLESVLADSRVVPRRLLALPLALLNILLIFRWWLWRITRVWALISGDPDASLSSQPPSGSE